MRRPSRRGPGKDGPAEPSETKELMPFRISQKNPPRTGRLSCGCSLAGRLLWTASFCASLLAQAPPKATAPLPKEELTVDQAVVEAIQKNLDLLAERSNIAIAEARILTARLRPNPEVSVTADHLDLLGTGFDLANAAGPPEYAIATDFTHETAGKRKRRVVAAQAALSVAKLRFLDPVRPRYHGVLS